MIDKDARSREDEYFWRKDQELIEKMRRAADAEKAQRELGRTAGLEDPELIRELAALGFTVDTLPLLPLLPLIQVAWAEGGVSDAERQLILKLARSRGVAAGSAADEQLSRWLTAAPATDVFTRATRLIRAMLTSGTAAGTAVSPDELVRYCEEIASASGGMFGMRKVSAEERALLSQIASTLEGRSA